MSTSTSVPASGIAPELTMPRAQAWREPLERLRRSRARRADLTMTGCFGVLGVKDEMVLRGLAASLACAAERGDERW
jgi:hypothetical protein